MILVLYWILWTSTGVLAECNRWLSLQQWPVGTALPRNGPRHTSAGLSIVLLPNSSPADPNLFPMAQQHGVQPGMAARLHKGENLCLVSPTHLFTCKWSLLNPGLGQVVWNSLSLLCWPVWQSTLQQTFLAVHWTQIILSFILRSNFLAVWLWILIFPTRVHS